MEDPAELVARPKEPQHATATFSKGSVVDEIETVSEADALYHRQLLKPAPRLEQAVEEASAAIKMDCTIPMAFHKNPEGGSDREVFVLETPVISLSPLPACVSSSASLTSSSGPGTDDSSCSSAPRHVSV
jgi:hypothetical protein